MILACAACLMCCPRVAVARGNHAAADGSRGFDPFLSDFMGAIDFGPLFSIGADVAGNRRLRALGPLIETLRLPDDGEFLAVRPFYSRIRDGAPTTIDEHAVWPAWTRRRAGREERWSVGGIAYRRDWDIECEHSRYYLRVLPVYFQGRDKEGGDYRAVFPAGGSIHDFLRQDEISFFLFPLCMHRRVNDVETRTYAWPIISTTSGGGIQRFTVFPFYGRARRGTDYERYFVLWPLWNHARFGFEGGAGHGYILFPIFGHAKLEGQESFFVLPPLFRFSSSADMSLVYCPWPLFQKSSGPVEKLYLWPLWGRKSREQGESWFAIWPLLHGESHMKPGLVESRRIAVRPVFSRETTRRKSKEGDFEEDLLSSRVKLWPLASYRREEDSSLFRAPALWPFTDYAAIERNYAPFWTLYSRTRHGAVSEDELLWGLFRYRRCGCGAKGFSLFPLFSFNSEDGNNRREWSFLKGLVGYEEGSSGGRSWRFLYMFRSNPVD